MTKVLGWYSSQMNGFGLNILAYDISLSKVRILQLIAVFLTVDGKISKLWIISESKLWQLAHSISNCSSKVFLIGFSTVFQSVKLSVTIYWLL